MQNHASNSAADLSWLGEARGHGLLSRLPASTVEALVKGAQRVEYPPGTVGLRWDRGPMAAIVLRGVLRSYIYYLDGTQVTIRYLQTGDLTGVFAPRLPALTRGVQAVDRSELLIIDADRVKEVSLTEPQFAWEMIEELTTVLNATQRALYLRAFGSVRQRVVSAIVDRAMCSGELEVGRRVLGTQQDLATAVGSVREVVAATLGALKHEGLVDVHRGGVVILAPERLAREADAAMGASADQRHL